jgi:hypothetical protein
MGEDDLLLGRSGRSTGSSHVKHGVRCWSGTSHPTSRRRHAYTLQARGKGPPRLTGGPSRRALCAGRTVVGPPKLHLKASALEVRSRIRAAERLKREIVNT